MHRESKFKQESWLNSETLWLYFQNKLLSRTVSLKTFQSHIVLNGLSSRNERTRKPFRLLCIILSIYLCYLCAHYRRDWKGLRRSKTVDSTTFPSGSSGAWKPRRFVIIIFIIIICFYFYFCTSFGAHSGSDLATFRRRRPADPFETRRGSLYERKNNWFGPSLWR